jgi:hypothetical protein
MSQLVADAVEPVCRTVYGYVLGFTDSRQVLGIELSGQWQLPGGPVEGEGTPQAAAIAVPPDCADPLRFGPLAIHVAEQTGLVLTDLSPPFAVNMHPAEDGHFDLSIYYLANACGERTGGVPLAGSQLPQFAPQCPAEPAMIRAFLRTGDPLAQPTWWQRWLGG